MFNSKKEIILESVIQLMSTGFLPELLLQFKTKEVVDHAGLSVLKKVLKVPTKFSTEFYTYYPLNN